MIAVWKALDECSPMVLVCGIGILLLAFMMWKPLHPRVHQVRQVLGGWDGTVRVHFVGKNIWASYSLPGKYNIPPHEDIDGFILPGAFPGKAPYVTCCFEKRGAGKDKDTIACRFVQRASEENPGMEVRLLDGVNVFDRELQGWTFQISITGPNYQTEKFTFDFCTSEQEVRN